MPQYTPPLPPVRRIVRRDRREAARADTDHGPRVLTRPSKPAAQQYSERLSRNLYVFCDWLTFKAQLRQPVPPLDNGQVVGFERDGSEKWRSRRWFAEPGSHSTTLQIRCDGAEVQLSGNIGRYERPDNVLGASVSDCWEMARAFIRERTGGEIDERSVKLTRVDLTTMLGCGCADWRERVLRALAGRRVGQRMRPTHWPTGGLSWKAQTRTVKVYDKAAELQDNAKGRPVDTELLAELSICGALRLELQLRGEYLRRENLRKLEAWSLSAERALMLELMEDLAMTQPIDTATKPELKAREYCIWGQWLEGENIWPVLIEDYSRPTAYRIRARIRKATGDDIRCVPPVVKPAPESHPAVQLQPWLPPPAYVFESPYASPEANRRITAACHGYRPPERSEEAPEQCLDAHLAGPDTPSSAKRRRSRCT